MRASHRRSARAWMPLVLAALCVPAVGLAQGGAAPDQEGDFRAGDQIRLFVQGQPELSQLYTVQPGPVLVLPEFGEIPLHGVARSELEDHLTVQLSRFFRDPVVSATSTIRIMVLGAVGQPGYLSVESRMLLTDVLEEAGGLARNARLGRIRIERGREHIWSGEPLQVAIIEGRSLADLGMRAGDQIVVPEQGQSALGRWALRLASPTLIFFLLRQYVF
jgi:protein involved in polysaccharide export with SLBB domain